MYRNTAEALDDAAVPSIPYRVASQSYSHIGRERHYTWTGIAATLIAASALALDLGRILARRIETGRVGLAIEDGFFVLIIVVLIFGSLIYQASRLGFLNRIASHRPADRVVLEKIYDSEHPRPLLLLVPSYREELRVVRQTLLAAALMEYPNRRVTLLIDDPPNPSDPAAARELAAMRRLPGEIETLLRAQRARYSSEMAAYGRRRALGPLDFASESLRIANLYHEAATWLEQQASAFEVLGHTDALFVRRILREPAEQHRARSEEFASRARVHGRAPSEKELLREYRRLAGLFAVPLSSFERKGFVNLSHASNKAMNLNSYVGLIGGNFREVIRGDGPHLEECESSIAQLRVPIADYIITVDADSLLLHDYAMRLIHVMERPEGRRFAVVQTPYTAVPGTPHLLERTAGAQTDVQWLQSQGATHFNATSWIGASALLRREALEDIREIGFERGYPIKRYIQDRTLVEDAESTIDLITRKWQLYNYPDRLSYSATPPDFGALVIQRRRWANGTLLILPKLFRYLLNGPGRIRRLPEGLVRSHYLSSVAVSNLGVLLLLTLPFDRDLTTIWLVLAALPYYVLYGRDLASNGYSWRDLPRVYALGLLLIPVNLGGVARSLHQWWTGFPSPFVRTPKVPGRTAAPALYVLIGAILPAYAVLVTIWDLLTSRWAHAGFGVFNALALGYAFCRFIGIRQGREDVVANLRMQPWFAAVRHAKRRSSWSTKRDTTDTANFLWFGRELAVRFDESAADLPGHAVPSAPLKPRVYEFAAHVRKRAARLPLRHIAAGAVAAALAGLIAAPSLFNFDPGRSAERLMAAARNFQAGSAPYNELQDADQLGDFTLVSNPPLEASAARAKFSPARAEEKIREALSVQGFTDIGVSAGPSGDVYLAGDVYSEDEAKYVTHIARHAVRAASIHFLHPDVLSPSGPAYFGINTQADPKLLGAKVTTVAIGSPAYKAGIRSGDLIRGFDGELVPDAETLTALVEAYQPGDRVTLRLWRGDGNQFLVVRLGEFTALALK